MDDYPSACSFPVAGSNWKAGCVERHLSGLERGKGREALPIATSGENHSQSTPKNGFENDSLPLTKED